MKSELVNKKNISKYSALLGDAERSAIIKRESSAVGVYDGDKPLGILTFSRTDPPDGKKNKLFFVDHYYVDPEHRGEGIFKKLLEKVKEVCRRQKIKGILIQTVMPGMEDTEKAVKALGFKKIKGGNQVYSFEVEQAKESPLMNYDTSSHDKHVIPISDLTIQQRRAFYASFRNRFPKELGPRSAGTDVLKDLSYVYVVGRDVKGFLFSGAFKRDEVYLASLLITPKYKHAAIIMLKRYLTDIMAGGVYKRIVVAAVNEASENLAEHLFKFNNVDKDHSEVHNFKLTVS